MFATPAEGRTAFGRPSRNWKSTVISVILWLVFISGVGLQTLGPKLKIEHRAFIMPSGLTTEGNEIRPDQLVQRERTLQWASGLSTLIGALALAVWYRRTLAGALQTQRSPKTARSL